LHISDGDCDLPVTSGSDGSGVCWWFSVLVVDEMDSLDCKSQDVLYTMFEWPSLANSKLILIGQLQTVCCALIGQSVM